MAAALGLGYFVRFLVYSSMLNMMDVMSLSVNRNSQSNASYGKLIILESF